MNDKPAIDPEVIEAWERANRSRPSVRSRSPRPTQPTHRQHNQAADDTTAAATIWNKMRGAG